MAKYSPSLALLLAAALTALPVSLAAAKKKPPVTKIKPAKKAPVTKAKPQKKPAPRSVNLAPRITPAPATPSAMPAATPRPRMEDLGQILAAGATDGLPLAARGAIVIDAQTGAPLYEKNADTPQFPASATKVMTALLVIEAGSLDQEVECTLEDSRIGESSLNLKPGQRFTRRQMLYGLMLKSANDVAHALARDNAGTMAAFAEKMTLRAAELGAKSTRFANPNGLHDRGHYCSPRDLAIITRAAMQQPFFRQVVATPRYDWVAAEGVRSLRNHNRLLASLPGCTGVKTGFTNPAQQVLVSALLRDNREVIAVVMHTDRPGIWEDSILLLSYGHLRPPGSAASVAGPK